MEISDGIANGSMEDAVSTETIPTEAGDGVLVTMAPGITERVPEHRCDMCDRVFMSMQGLRSHERSHSATAMINRDDKYSCQYCQFQSAFRHKYGEKYPNSHFILYLRCQKNVSMEPNSVHPQLSRFVFPSVWTDTFSLITDITNHSGVNSVPLNQPT